MSHQSRRYFEHLYAELCMAVDRRLSRYDIWLAIWEAGGDPDDLSREQLEVFLEEHLDGILREEGLRLTGAKRRRLRRSLRAFDPSQPTPEEWMSRLLPDHRDGPHAADQRAR